MAIRRRDDAGSLPVALLLVLVGSALSALLAPIVITQIQATRIDALRVHALHAAETGLNVALGQIRAANDGNGNGMLAKLPCDTLTGTVGTGGTGRYQVRIDYLDQDPQGKAGDWVTANRIQCATGAGIPRTPAFALLRAQGTDRATGAFDGEGTRSLQATYTFSTTNSNIAGGLIRVFRSETSAPDLCLDAGSSAPLAGTSVRMQNCSAGSNQQEFSYEKNLNIVLTSSRTASKPLGLCLDAGTPHVAGGIVRLEPCAGTTEPRQQWGQNDYANLEGTADGSTLDGFCFNVQTPETPGSYVVLGSRAANLCYQPFSIVQTFSPDGSVGAGAAGADSGQLVNFRQFSRCLDVTEMRPNAHYTIVWPCKQAPDPANVSWNQKWALPAIAPGASSATGAIITEAPQGTYCLKSPLSTAAANYVNLQRCPEGAPPPALSWTVYQDTGSYATSYTIVDSNGYCLAPTDPSAQPPDFWPKVNGISKTVVAPCDGSTSQKWNAPPNILHSIPLKDIGEN